jgi:UDP-N-acetylmuramate-alanine ligase
MKVYAVISKLYNQEPDHLIFFDSLDKAKNFLQEMSNTYKQDCIHWHKTKELFKVKNMTINKMVYTVYIEKYEVY